VHWEQFELWCGLYSSQKLLEFAFTYLEIIVQIMHIAIFMTVLMQQGGVSQTSPKQPEWYEKVTGVIAIPAAIIACAYSYLLIKKTRLESRKIELEIEQQRHATATAPPEAVRSSATAVASSETVEQALKNRLLLIVIIRFILWRLVDACYGWIITPLQWAWTIVMVPLSQTFIRSNMMDGAPNFIKIGSLRSLSQSRHLSAKWAPL
jgi:hypothetical protein